MQQPRKPALSHVEAAALPKSLTLAVIWRGVFHDQWRCQCLSPQIGDKCQLSVGTFGGNTTITYDANTLTCWFLRSDMAFE